MLVLRCAYIGLKYHGFQVQPEVPTVQGEIAKVLERLGYEKNLKYVSRTDAGVSAVDQIISVRIVDEDILETLNRELPGDIRIHAYTKREFSDLGILYKEYWYFAPKFLLDRILLKDAMEYITGMKHNYIQLIKKPTQVTIGDALMTIYVSAEMRNNFMIFRVKGKKFLWEQVRRLINLLVSVGLRRISMETFKRILNGEPYPSGIPPAPPEGLVLWRIRTRHDDEFRTIIPRKEIEDWVSRHVKKAVLAAKWVLPARERRVGYD